MGLIGLAQLLGMPPGTVFRFRETAALFLLAGAGGFEPLCEVEDAPACLGSLDPERVYVLARDELKDLKRKVDRAYLLANL